MSAASTLGRANHKPKSKRMTPTSVVSGGAQRSDAGGGDAGRRPPLGEEPEQHPAGLGGEQVAQHRRDPSGGVLGRTARPEAVDQRPGLLAQPTAGIHQILASRPQRPQRRRCRAVQVHQRALAAGQQLADGRRVQPVGLAPPVALLLRTAATCAGFSKRTTSSSRSSRWAVRVWWWCPAASIPTTTIAALTLALAAPSMRSSSASPARSATSRTPSTTTSPSKLDATTNQVALATSMPTSSTRLGSTPRTSSKNAPARWPPMWTPCIIVLPLSADRFL